MSANTSLNILASEADSLLAQAEKLRVEMDALPPGDSRRDVYEKMILDLLDRSRRLSIAVTVSAST